MYERIRGQKCELTQEEKEMARNLALILADSRASIAHLELIWHEAKKNIVASV